MEEEIHVGQISSAATGVSVCPPSLHSKQRPWVHASESAALTQVATWSVNEMKGKSTPHLLARPPFQSHRCGSPFLLLSPVGPSWRGWLKQHDLELPQENPRLLWTTSVWKTQRLSTQSVDAVSLTWWGTWCIRVTNFASCWTKRRQKA